jgi:hypothetical protein
MTGQPTSRTVLDTQHAAARELGMAMQDAHTTCYGDLLQLSFTAQQQWRAATDTYLQDVRAASAGDDAYQRAATAYGTLQREYARIQAEYAKACDERSARLQTSLGSVANAARVKVLDGWIEHLQALRQAAASAVAGAPSQG